MFKMTVEQAHIYQGAHLMDFGAITVYTDGIVYMPIKKRGHPGNFDEPFIYKFNVDGPVIDRFGIIAGSTSSMCMRECVKISMITPGK